jgi:hypothetical protein
MEITVNKALAPPDFDVEALKRSLEQSAHFRNRAAAKRSPQRNFAAATRQIRQDTAQAVEAELSRAGVDVRKLRETHAHSQQLLRDAAGTLRPRVTPSAAPGSTAAAPTSSRFRSLQALAGRAVPLDQPSQLIVLNEAYGFTQEPYDPGTSASLAPGNVFFRTVRNQSASDPESGETNYVDFAFTYLWNSNTPMLVDVLTALDLYGAVTASAQGNTVIFYPIFYFSTRCRVSGSISLSSSWGGPLEFSGQYDFANVFAHTHTIEDQEGWLFNREHHDMSFNGFFLPANAPLIINVWTSFETDFDFNDNDSDSYGYYDFAFENPDFRIACPGVVLIATPVTLF